MRRFDFTIDLRMMRLLQGLEIMTGPCCWEYALLSAAEELCTLLLRLTGGLPSVRHERNWHSHLIPHQVCSSVD